jgi:hypothetical protein
MPFEQYTPPQGFQPAGDVTITPPAELPFDMDTSPTQNSTNAVSSGGVYTALATKQATITPPSSNPSEYVLDGNFGFINLQEKVEEIVDGLDLGTGGGSEENTYVTQAQLDDYIGDAITAPINLSHQTATRYASYTQSIARSIFSLSGGNANVALVAAPAGCNVTIGESTVAITWIPTFTGAHYIVFWVSNGAKQGQIASLKITVAASETITPIDDLVLTSASISAGKLVNIYDDGGTPKMRLAIATAVGTIAVAFVSENAASGETLVPKYSGNINPYFTGLTPGKRYFLSTTVPGGISEYGPDAGTGHVWQPVGRAISSTELLLDIDEHTIRSGS